MDHSTQLTEDAYATPAQGPLAEPSSRTRRRARALAVMACSLWALSAQAQPQTETIEPDALQAGLSQQVRQLALEGNRVKPAGVNRVEVKLGQLNPRLRLAPCQRVEPYLPTGTTLWGPARIGLRCTQGRTHWNVYLPITINAYGPGWVAAAPLPAGSVISARDLVQAEVNLAEDRQQPLTDVQVALGRTLARAMNAGDTLSRDDLKARQWFSAGDSVKVLARGAGFSVAGMGQALGHGLEGQPVRVRIDVGRVVTGQPVGEHLVEVPL